jgi:prepilin peptidase CpaA
VSVVAVAAGYGLLLGSLGWYALGDERVVPRGRRGRWALLVPPATAAVGVALLPSGGPLPARLAAVAFAAVFLVLAASDLDARRIPNRIIGAAMLLAVVASPWLPAGGALMALLGAGSGLALLLVPYVVLNGGFGAGDVKLAAAIGAVLGFPLALHALALGVLLGGIGSIVLVAYGLARGRPARGQRLAYGPFLVAGALILLITQTHNL